MSIYPAELWEDQLPKPEEPEVKIELTCPYCERDFVGEGHIARVGEHEEITCSPACARGFEGFHELAPANFRTT